LRCVLHERVDHNQSHHGLNDRHGARQHAGVVAALAQHHGLTSCEVADENIISVDVLQRDVTI